MPRLTFTSKHLNAETEFHASADFISCLMTAAIAALPQFLEAFMGCLAGATPGPGYQPGDRVRCPPIQKP